MVEPVRQQGKKVFESSTEIKEHSPCEAYLDAIPDIQIVLDDKKRVVFANRAAEELTGYKREDIIGISLENIPFLQRIELTLGKQIEEEVTKKSGERFYGLIRLDLIEGKGYMLTIRDVTLLREREEELVSQHSYMESLVRSSPVGLIVLDIQGRPTMVSEKFVKDLGLSAEKIIGMSPQDFFLREDLPKVMRGMEETRIGYSSAQVTMQKGDGSAFPAILSWGAVKDRSGKLTNLIASITDITAVEKEREYTRNLLEGLAAPLWTYDANLKVNYLNPEFARAFGYGEKDLVGLDVEGMTDTLIKKEEIPALEKVLRDVTKPMLDMRTTIVTKDGREIPVLLSSAPVYAKEEFRGLVVTATNVSDLESERKRLEQIMEVLPVGLVLTSYSPRAEERKWIYANSTLEKITGYDRAEMMGKSIVEQPIMDRSQREEMERNFGGSYELRAKSKSGRELFLRTSFGTVKDLEGKPREEVVALTDVTELKQANEFKETLLDNLPVGVWVGDSEGRCTYVNKTYVDDLGYSREEILGRKDEESPYVCESGEPYMKEGTLEAFRKIWTESRKGKIGSGIVPCRMKDGKIGLFRVAEIPYAGGWMDVAMNVTDGFVREKELQELIEVIGASLSRISEGDLAVKLDASKVAESYRPIAEDVNRMAESVRALVSRVREVGEQVTNSVRDMSNNLREMGTSAQQIAGAINQLAQGAGNLATLSQNMQSLSNNLRDLMKNITSASEALLETSGILSDRSAEGRKASERMSGVSDSFMSSMNTIADTAETLNSDVQGINEVVDIITSIADQTNMLALNAAIEAARAGEQGRAFSVVADEIRKLADQSRSSIQRIREMVSSISAQRGSLMEVVNSGRKSAQSATETVKASSEAFGAVITGLEELINGIRDIGSLIEHESTNVGELAKGIEEISAIAEENAASVEESSASVEEQTAGIEELSAKSEELSAGAGDLADSLKAFRG